MGIGETGRMGVWIGEKLWARRCSSPRCELDRLRDGGTPSAYVKNRSLSREGGSSNAGVEGLEALVEDRLPLVLLLSPGLREEADELALGRVFVLLVLLPGAATLLSSLLLPIPAEEVFGTTNSIAPLSGELSSRGEGGAPVLAGVKVAPGCEVQERDLALRRASLTSVVAVLLELAERELALTRASAEECSASTASALAFTIRVRELLCALRPDDPLIELGPFVWWCGPSPFKLPASPR